MTLKLQLHDAIYRLRFCSNSLTHILSLSNSNNNVASFQKNRGDKSHHVIVALKKFHDVKKHYISYPTESFIPRKLLLFFQNKMKIADSL